MSQWYFIAAAAVVIGLLVINLLKRIDNRLIDGFGNSRRSSSRLVSRADLFDGSRHIPVSLALTSSSIHYECQGMSGALDLEWVDEIEYENELLTGQSVVSGRVLRLRCSSRSFEFVLAPEAAAAWEQSLPARRNARPAVVETTAPPDLTALEGASNEARPSLLNRFMRHGSS